MARKSINKKKQKPVVHRPKNKSYGRKPSSSGGALSWLFRITLVTAVAGLLFWQWDNILAWLDDITQGTVGLFGWGLVVVLVAILVIASIIWRQQLAEVARRYKLYHWNKWLGAIAFIFAAWGVLALLDLGGSFGQTIIGGEMNEIGLLRVLGLFFLGIVLVIPGLCWRAVKAFFRLLASPFRPRRRMPSSTDEEYGRRVGETAYFAHHHEERKARADAMKAPEVLVPPEMPRDEMKPKLPKEANKPLHGSSTAPLKSSQEELKQVAQEVWKKYGESPSLVEINGWRLPPLDILDATHEIEFDEVDNVQRAHLIEEALASYGVEAKVVQINAGPTVTQFGIEPGWDRKYREVRERDSDGNIIKKQKEISKTRVKVEKITSLANDLALALAAPSIRIEAPVPGKSIVGVEVPNTSFGIVSLRGVIETNSFQKILRRSTLALALGKGAGGEAIAGDLGKMPHLLIAGATGSGKTVCLNAIICCLLLNNAPSECRFIMIDPKRVELTLFNSLPHLAVPVIVDAQKSLGALRWLNQEMDKRYQRLAADGARNVEAYNKKREGEEKMPYVVLIIDELADLMMAGFDEVEHILCRLAQLSRAVGIHLVVATQRPSVDVITGLIKANFPTRISFAVTSQVDSRTILDFGGAEKLLGRGDMLYMPTEAAKPKRLQGCFVSDAEAERLVYFWNSQGRKEEMLLKVEDLAKSQITAREEGYPEDPLMESARQLAEEHKSISTSYLQRRLHIGYPRAARIMEKLQEELEEVEGDEDSS